MIPDNPNIYSSATHPQTLLGAFRYPDNIISDDELVDYEFGGYALQDTSHGLEFQVWKGEWTSSTGDVILSPLTVGEPVVIFNEEEVEELAFTFDQNMRWCAAVRLSNGTVKFRWYDSEDEQYVISYLSDITSVRVTFDDKRQQQIQQGAADIIITYIRNGRVRWRVQRDRFLQEYTYAGQIFSDNIRITHFGMSEKLRLQWRLAQRRIK